MTNAQTVDADWRPWDGPASRADDAALVRRAKAGDQLAFREIVERHQTRVMSFVYRILRNPNDADDVAQEVFAGAFFALRKSELRGTLIWWLYRTAANESFERLRRKWRQPPASERDLGEPALLALLDSLSQQNRDLLLLREVEGLSLEEIAAITGSGESAISLRLFRARRDLAAAARRAARSTGGEGGA